MRPHNCVSATTDGHVIGVHPLPRPVHVFGSTHLAHGSTQRQNQHAKPSRTPDEVALLRQARKADIERRCSLLSPPINPNVLQHIEAYQAAMLIAAPMTELAWNMLEPRLLAQRESAELLEHTREQNMAILRLASQPISREAFSNKSTTDQNREYERKLQPLRTRLGEIADEYIYGQWHGGRALTWDNTPIFTANTLHHIWRSYTSEQQSSEHRIRAEDQATGQHERGSNKTNALTLDNMKWVYDTKVRALADKHRREHFLCADCPGTGGAKWFSFESLMQHFGAKHTSSFSKGNIVVHWQTAEWPEEPPFHLIPAKVAKSDHWDAGSNNRTDKCSSAPGNIVLEPVHYMRPTSTSNLDIFPAQRVESGSFAADPKQESERVDTGTSLFGTDDTAKKLKLVNELSAVWSAVHGIETDLECVLVRTVFHHAVKSFSAQYGHDPPLALVKEALSSQAALQTLRNSKGLACKVCVANANLVGDSTTPYYGRIRNVKLFKLLPLLEHFTQMHMGDSSSSCVANIVETPFDVGIEELRNATGMDETKLALIVAILEETCDPDARLAISAHNTNARPVLVGSNGILHRLEQKTGAQAKRKKSKPGEIAQASRLTKAKDKGHPTSLILDGSHLEKQTLDPSRFDTDIGRSEEPKVVPITQANVTKSLALSEPQQASSFTPVAVERSYRNPSVARSTGSPSQQERPHSDLTAAPRAPLDIAAILASINGQTRSQASETPTHFSARLDRQPLGNRQERYERQRDSERYTPMTNAAQTAFHHASQQYSTRRSFSDGVEALRASLSTGPSKHAYAKGSETEYQPISQQAVTATRRRYEQEWRYDQHGATRQEEAVQYIQLPAQQHAQNGDYHHLLPQQITYIDEYGRPVELIPIERAPLPQVQYISDAYGHQTHAHPVSGRLHASHADPGQDWTQYPTVYDTTQLDDNEYSYSRDVHRVAESAPHPRFS
jgi:hypothetical protein